MKTSARRYIAGCAAVWLLALPAAAYADAVVGETAPPFTATDVLGVTRSLAEFRGQVVVLEWFNHDCPFTRKHYDTGNMQRLQETYTDRGVVWISINSSAPGKQGSLTPQKAQDLTAEKKAVPTVVILDERGEIGRLYGAKTTPHLFIVNGDGVLVYQGAIDDQRSADPSTVEGADNFVSEALDATLEGRPVATPATPPYGCSVKY